MSIPNLPPFSIGSQVPGASGAFNLPNTTNASNVDVTLPITTDDLLFDAFGTFSGGGFTGGTPGFGLRPEDAAYAQSLYGSNPLLAYQSVTSYLTLDNFLPQSAGDPATQNPDSFNSYKANYLGNLSPQSAVDLAMYLAGPILQSPGF